MQTHSIPGSDAYMRNWEDEPRGGWDTFQAARHRHLTRLADQSDRFGTGDVDGHHTFDWSLIAGIDGEG
jgi:hypothetical protein